VGLWDLSFCKIGSDKKTAVIRKGGTQMMKKMMKKSGGFLLATMGLILLISFLIGETVRCQSKASEKELENYYAALEKQMVIETREYLSEAGFRNSGVMLTKVIDESGAREYTLTVHHKKINALTPAERMGLEERISGFDFGDENCSFEHKFLMTD